MYWATILYHYHWVNYLYNSVAVFIIHFFCSYWLVKSTLLPCSILGFRFFSFFRLNFISVHLFFFAIGIISFFLSSISFNVPESFFYNAIFNFSVVLSLYLSFIILYFFLLIPFYFFSLNLLVYLSWFLLLSLLYFLLL